MTPIEQAKVMDAFNANVKKLRRGAWFCYHTGYLARDRRTQQTQRTVAQFMYDAYEADRVILIQRKLGEGVYEYWAVGR